MSETKIDPMDCYYDCSFQVTDIGDRRFSSGWTSHGIKCIDSEYSNRIRNILRPVVKLVKVSRTPHYFDGNHRSRYWDEYTEMPLDEEFYSYDRVVYAYREDIYNELPIPENVDKWRGGYLDANKNPIYQKVSIMIPEYCYTHPTYSPEFKGENPDVLRNEIKSCPNLHNVIKNNLIENLDSILLQIKKFGVSL